jgi:hypothetical protein
MYVRTPKCSYGNKETLEEKSQQRRRRKKGHSVASKMIVNVIYGLKNASFVLTVIDFSSSSVPAPPLYPLRGTPFFFFFSFFAVVHVSLLCFAFNLVYKSRFTKSGNLSAFLLHKNITDQ